MKNDLRGLIGELARLHDNNRDECEKLVAEYYGMCHNFAGSVKPLSGPSPARVATEYVLDGLIQGNTTTPAAAERFAGSIETCNALLRMCAVVEQYPSIGDFMNAIRKAAATAAHGLNPKQP